MVPVLAGDVDVHWQPNMARNKISDIQRDDKRYGGALMMTAFQVGPQLRSSIVLTMALGMGRCGKLVVVLPFQTMLVWSSPRLYSRF